MYTVFEYIKLNYLSIHQQQIRNRNNPIYNCIKKIKYLEISLSKVLKYLCMKTFKTLMKEIFKRHKRKHILYLLTGRINIVNTSILSKAILHIHCSLFQNSKVFFTKQKKKFYNLYKTVVLFSLQVMSDSL